MKFRPKNKPKEKHEVAYEMGHRVSEDGQQVVVYLTFDRPIRDLIMTVPQARFIADNLHETADKALAHKEPQ